MTPGQLAVLNRTVATVVGMLADLDLDGAMVLMENTAKMARAHEPLDWAKAKSSHERMTALIDAARTFQNTVRNISEIAREERKAPSPIILPN